MTEALREKLDAALSECAGFHIRFKDDRAQVIDAILPLIESDRAALEAELVGIQNMLLLCGEPELDKHQHSSAQTKIRALIDGTIVLRAEVARLREALEFYADEKNWTGGTVLDMESSRFNGWSLARTALHPELNEKKEA